jgi:hypothetical protein
MARAVGPIEASTGDSRGASANLLYALYRTESSRKLTSQLLFPGSRKGIEIEIVMIGDANIGVEIFIVFRLLTKRGEIISGPVETNHCCFETCPHPVKRTGKFTNLIVRLKGNGSIQMSPAYLIGNGLQIEKGTDHFASDNNR